MTVGIDVTVNQWISKVAKKIHPTGVKPCKRCGKSLEISYVYPEEILLKRFQNRYGERCQISPLQTIDEVVRHIIKICGSSELKSLTELISTRGIESLMSLQE